MHLFIGNTISKTFVFKRLTVFKYFRLPQDIYQTAKVAKVLLAVNNGNCAQYKGKSLDDIEVSDVDADESDAEEQLELHETEHDELYTSEQTGNV